MNALMRLAAAIIVAAFVFVAGTAAALAHAQLLGSDPPEGAVLPASPPAIELKFSEPVRPLVARLTDPNGKTHVITGVGDRGQAVTFALPDELQRGTHLLSWRVTSSDGHPIGGGLLFSIGAPSTNAPGAAAEVDPVVRTGIWAARLLIISGLIFGVGGALFRSIAGAQSRECRILPLAIVAGLAGAAALIPLQGLDALGLPIASIFDSAVFSAGLTATSYGTAALLAATALLLAFAGLQPERIGLARVLSALAFVIAGIAFAAAGHAASAPPRGLMVPAVLVHALAAMFWLGALIPLGAALVAGGGGSVLPLRRFSAIIPFAIAALLASGIAIAVVQVQTLAALLTSDYGRVLLIKLALVAAMFALALFNRYRLTQPANAGDVRARSKLRRSIAAEIVLGLAVIAVLGLWRFTPPPRALALSAPSQEIQQVRASNEDVSALLTIQPPIVGPAVVDVGEITLAGKPLKPLGVKVELGKPSYGIGPFEKEARLSGEGTWRAEGYLLPLDGFWVVNVTILVSDFRSVTLTDVFDVRKASR